MDIIFFSAWRKEDDAQTFASCSTCTTTAVEKDFWVSGWVDLEDEIDLRDVEAAGCYVGGEKNGWGDGVGEAGEVLGADGGGVFAVERDDVKG